MPSKNQLSSSIDSDIAFIKRRTPFATSKSKTLIFNKATGTQPRKSQRLVMLDDLDISV